MGIKSSLLSSLAPLATAAPYHLLIYGTLLGTELYQVPQNPREILARIASSNTLLILPEFRYD